MALPLRDFSEGKGGGVITRNRIDLLAGLFVGLVGVIALIEAMNFELGSARRMGPGYFPFYIGNCHNYQAGLAKFAVFHALLLTCSSRLCGNGIHHIAVKRRRQHRVPIFSSLA